MQRSRVRSMVPVLIALGGVFAGVAAPAHSDDDPFAPPGTVAIKLHLPDRATLERLLASGFHPEEAGRDYVGFRVTPAQLETLHSLGLDVEAWTYEVSREGAELLFTSYSQMVAELNQVVADHPAIARLSTIGQSVQGRNILALKVTANPDAEEAEPEVRIVGAHHGDERMSVEICLNLAQHLTDNYGSNPLVTDLVNSREIWIVPMVNPDGVEAVSRYNAHGVDLNRNYGYMWEYGGSGGFSEPETRAMAALATENWFVLSLSFHTSGDVVNSVWNYTPIYSEDDALVTTLSDGYASYNGYWAVRGWYWYETHGDCNDWSYGARADIDWTIETSDSGESTVWNLNRDAILYIIDAAGWGVHGTVTDAVTGEPLRASVWVDGNGWPAFTDPIAGDYHKPLLGGVYSLRVSANGYEDAIIPAVSIPPEGGVTVGVELQPGAGAYADRVEIANVPDPSNDYNNPTLTMSMLGAPDDVGCSIGVGGQVVLDLGPDSRVSDLPGDDLRVHESSEDAGADGYAIYGGESYLGPWTLIGSGVGTTAYDLAVSGLDSARYLRIVDDGGGNPSATYPGLELDAIEVLGELVAAGEISPAPAGFSLGPPSPNPFAGGGVRARLVAPEQDRRVDVLDVAGRFVAGLVPRRSAGGDLEVRWDGLAGDGRAVAPGLYFIRLTAGSATAAQKVHVVR